MSDPKSNPRELTGRHVLLWLVSFFVVVFAVNGVLVRAAISTFGGVETTSSYMAGLQFEHEVAVAEQQNALHWRGTGGMLHDFAGQAVLDISARDAQGKVLAGLSADARLAHPADERLDRVIDMRPVSGDAFRGGAPAQPGPLDLIVGLFS